jgi:hypothetical protein
MSITDCGRLKRAGLPFCNPRSSVPALVLMTMCLVPPVRAQGQEELAQKVKAGMLVEFARYTTWPQHKFQAPEDPVVIGVMDDDALAGVLGELLEREKPRVQGRRVTVRKLPRLDLEDPAQAAQFSEQVTGLHELYLGDADRRKMREVLRRLEGEPVVTISQLPRFAEDGGMIGLFLDKGRFRFDINTGSIDAAALKLSARVLQLARRVIKQE